MSTLNYTSQDSAEKAETGLFYHILIYFYLQTQTESIWCENWSQLG